jgi:hypothetical protein
MYSSTIICIASFAANLYRTVYRLDVLANFWPLLFHHAYSSCMVYETIDQSLKFDLALIKSEEVMHVDNRADYMYSSDA